MNELPQRVRSWLSKAFRYLQRWRDLLSPYWHSATIEQLSRAFRLAEEVMSFNFATLPVIVKSRRY